MRDAQKGQTSYPPNPGGYFARPESARTASSPKDAPCLMQGRNSSADPRFTFHYSWERGENAAGGLFQHPARSLSDIAFVTRRRRCGQM